MAITAIISDIHSNIHALRAVLDHAREQGADRIICLGDVIGYGAHPEECVDLARTFAVCLRGNHEQGCLGQWDEFNSDAKAATVWTRRRLKPGLFPAAVKRERWQFINATQKSFEEDDVLYVHGSPRDPVWEYIFESDCADVLGDVSEKLTENMALLKGPCFVGHTHLPGVIGDDCHFSTPEMLGGTLELKDGAKAIVNVGSVGQPRDRNPKACYVLRDAARITWCRVEYDAEAAARDIAAARALAAFLGERLLKGT